MSSEGYVFLHSVNGDINVMSAEERHISQTEKEKQNYDGVKFFDKSFGDKVKSGFSVATFDIENKKETTTKDITLQTLP